MICAFGLAEAAFNERPIGDFLILEDSYEAHLADKGFYRSASGAGWISRWSALVAATPKDNSKRAGAKTERRWASGKQQIIEAVVDPL